MGINDKRLGGITSEGLDWFEKKMDDLGIPREEYAVQAGGVVVLTFWGRIDRLIELKDT